MVNGKSPDISYNSRTLGDKASKEKTGRVQIGNEGAEDLSVLSEARTQWSRFPI